MSARFRRAYGDRPAHLVVLVLCFAVAGLAARRVAPDPLHWRYVAWFLGAVLASDLVLVPLYGVVDAVLRHGLPRGAVNHVRVPALLSGLLLLVFAPTVLHRSAGQLRATSGLPQDAFLGRWLAMTAVLFAVSAVLYGVRRLSGRA